MARAKKTIEKADVKMALLKQKIAEAPKYNASIMPSIESSMQAIEKAGSYIISSDPSKVFKEVLLQCTHEELGAALEGYKVSNDETIRRSFDLLLALLYVGMLCWGYSV